MRRVVAVLGGLLWFGIAHGGEAPISLSCSGKIHTFGYQGDNPVKLSIVIEGGRVRGVSVDDPYVTTTTAQKIKFSIAEEKENGFGTSGELDRFTGELNIYEWSWYQSVKGRQHIPMFMTVATCRPVRPLF